MKNIKFFNLKNDIFMAVKNRIILHGLVNEVGGRNIRTFTVNTCIKICDKFSVNNLKF